jgi:predicted O-linked N-acetylglucosamine transferase (SPINDLY family)
VNVEDSVRASFDTALRLWRAGNLRGALAECAALRAAEPDRIEVLNLLAELHGALHEPDAAAECLHRVAVLTPSDAATLRRLANAQFDAGRYDASKTSYRCAIALDPCSVRAHNNLGRVLERTGEWTEAADCYRRALALDPGYAAGHVNLGNMLSRSGARDEALACYQKAAVLKPGLGEAALHCARMLFELQRASEGFEWAQRAVQLLPEYPEAWFVRGGILKELERAEEALASCDRAIALRPDFVPALYARANLLRGLGDHRGAVAGFREALQVDPGCESARMGIAVAAIPALPWTAEEAADSRTAFEAAVLELEEDLRRRPCRDEIALVGAVQPFFLAYQEHDHRAAYAAHGALCAGLMENWQRREGLEAGPRTGDAARRIDDGARRTGGAASRPGIAIVSAQIADHPVYNAITRGWLRRLDRDRFTLEVYHLGGECDAETSAARALADHFEAGPRSLREWASLILERRPQVIIYPEIGMDQITLQLASMRLAPTQIVAWGHPVTSGLPTIDYYLSGDAFEPPDGAHHYTEKLVRLPNLGSYYEPPIHAESVGPISRLGAPSAGARAPVLVCAGTPYKYSPQYDAVLAEIAKRLGPCQFHFFKSRDSALNRRLLARLHEAFQGAGLDSASHLVLRPWLPAHEFHAFLRSADLFLDTIGFSGFNTVMQAVECEIPVVTHRGRFMRGRLGSAILERLDLAQCVADSTRAYVDIAVSLIQDHAFRMSVRERMRAALPRLHRDHVAVQGLQEFLVGIV